MNETAGYRESADSGYKAWLGYRRPESGRGGQYASWCTAVVSSEEHPLIQTAAAELVRAITALTGMTPQTGAASAAGEGPCIVIGTIPGGPPLLRRVFGVDTAGRTGADAAGQPGVGTAGPNGTNAAGQPGAYTAEQLGEEGFAIRYSEAEDCIAVGAARPAGVLHGVFHLLRLMAAGQPPAELDVLEQPSNRLRMVNHWDNFDGSIERGYAGRSFFYDDNRFLHDTERLRDYARLLASVGINGISINNVNVHRLETLFITELYLPDVAEMAAVFRAYGIRLFLSVNYASTLEIGALTTADPLDPQVQEWWKRKAEEIYRFIPDFGGFVVKADSENRPGPFTYGRNHADGANMLAEALAPYGGLVIWRCFVYNCKQDWRDRKTDRARAAYDHFKPLDGCFHDNVVLQIKNGPMDFQVREPVSPLFGAMEDTGQVLEFQITQEYTGQQRHLCYLVPQWKEVLDFNTCAAPDDAPVKRIIAGTLHGRQHNGIAAVVNVGNDANWTGHLLAQANLYGYGRLAWNPELGAEEIAEEWIALTFGGDERQVKVIRGMLLDSWRIYENYTAPLGVGWMVNPEHHYGPNVDGYEYSQWGTYHYADHHGIGVDRTVKSGTGYSGQYYSPVAELYESPDSCPDELLLFFHHVPYTYVLKSGKTVIQHIYDTHFEGAEQAAELVARWQQLAGEMEEGLYAQVLARLQEQAEHAKEWRDRINTYFFRISGITDQAGRTIY
ncbi:alpha-glucuronidase family glycosyl hydrolase [Paenibacillus tepidiphilus]|uniref:alpha-glucuronidase family glycosyl hydrolase n=1 Tax=Paenibacillus tepidiphilus TaxID=2608683 RepID=UPI00123B193B|nr:alpha-glucuronidase family glycosyl hydrolase [Paenibacillus tepidiphilus]